MGEKLAWLFAEKAKEEEEEEEQEIWRFNLITVDGVAADGVIRYI